jgi:hypothetical protein
MRLRHFALLPAFAFLAVLPAQACSCLVFDSAGEQAESADIVFIGRVIHSGPVADPRPRWRRWLGWRGREAPDHRQQITTFQPEEVLKGTLRGDIAISHPPGVQRAACGIDFPRNEPIVVLATRSAQGAGFITSACYRAGFSAQAYASALSR